MRKLDTLKKNYEFRKVLTKGKYYRGNVIDIYVRQNKKDKNYIGIAVSVKAAKATKRNRIKRLIRENYRLLKPNIEKGYDIVFLWKKNSSIEDADFYKIRKDIIVIFKKATILSKDMEP